MELVPAYGRDYKSAKAVKADFDANKDFIIVDFHSPYYGKAINKQDIAVDGAHVLLRYDRLRKVVAIKVPKA